MTTYNVRMRDRLTEIDAIITNLVQHYSLKYSSEMYLFAEEVSVLLNKLLSLKSADMSLQMNVSKVLKTSYEKATSLLYLDMEAAMTETVTTGGTSTAYLYPLKMSILKDFINSFSSEMQLSAAAMPVTLEFLLNAEPYMILSPGTLTINEEVFEGTSLSNTLSLSASAVHDFSLSLNENTLYLSAETAALYYQLYLESQISALLTMTDENCFLAEKFTEMESGLFISVVGTENVEKYAQFSSGLLLSSEISSTATKYAEFGNSLILDCESNAGMTVYHPLSDWDDFSLADMDGETLNTLDFLEIL